MIRQRFVSALLMAATLVGVLLFAPMPISAAFLALVVLVGGWEWSALAGCRRAAGKASYVAAVVVAMSIVWWLSARGGQVSLLLAASLAGWLALLAWVVRYPVAVPAWLTVGSGWLVLSCAWVFMLDLLAFPKGGLHVLFLFFVVAAADIGAFFAGRALGRRRLAPAVSPGKTWEGVAGGLALASVAGVIGAGFFGYPAVPFVAVCLGMAAISVLGDLSVSMLKRNAGLKDTGTLLPGHGGILDRIDSLLAATPVYLLGLGWLLAP